MSPELSVVIPTLGRPSLARVLARLAGQEGAEPFQAVIALDPQADRRSVEAMISVAMPGADLVEASVPGASAARNTGLRKATAPVVLFIGDDILAGRRLLAEHLDWHRRYPGAEAAVLGRVDWARELKVTPFMRWLDQGLQFDFDAIEGTRTDAGKLYTANVSIKRELIERVGGFDEGLPFLYEDIELGYRLSREGLCLHYNAMARAEHLHAVTLDQYADRMRIAARAERALVRKHPELPETLHERFSRVLQEARPSGRGARLVGFMPRGTPWIGARAWASAEAQYEWSMARAFEAEWARANQEERESAAGLDGGSQPSGSPPAGP